MTNNSETVKVSEHFNSIYEEVHSVCDEAWGTTMKMDLVKGDFEKDAILKWVNHMECHGVKVLRFAKALRLMKGSGHVTLEDLEQAIRLIESGEDKEILKPINHD